jgi:hypothetical protein
MKATLTFSRTKGQEPTIELSLVLVRDLSLLSMVLAVSPLGAKSWCDLGTGRWQFCRVNWGTEIVVIILIVTMVDASAIGFFLTAGHPFGLLMTAPQSDMANEFILVVYYTMKEHEKATDSTTAAAHGTDAALQNLNCFAVRVPGNVVCQVRAIVIAIVRTRFVWRSNRR